jgi:hypothetical protein
MVIKAEDAVTAPPPTAPAGGEPMLAQPMGEHTGTAPMEMMSKGFLGGARSLAEADAFLGRSASPVLLDSFGILGAVLTNIAGPEHADSIKATLAEFQTGVDQATVRTLNDVAKYITAKGGNEVTEPPITPEVPPEVAAAPVAPSEPVVTPPEPEVPATDPVPEPVAAVVHPLDGPFAALRQTYDHALASALAPQDRLALMQTPYDALQDAVMRAFAEPTAPEPNAQAAQTTREDLAALVAAQVAPLQAEMRAFMAAVAPVVARMSAAPKVEPPVPPAPLTPRVGVERRAFRLVPRSQSAPGGGLVPFGEPPKKPSLLRALTRRSVGIIE